MELWTLWVESIQDLLEFFSTQVGVGAGLGIALLTVTLRAAWLPLSWSSAYRGAVRQKRMAKLAPAAQRIRDKFAQDPRRLAEETMRLYREHGLSPIDGRGLLAAIAQMPLFIGMFQALRDGVANTRFLWAPNLSRPDVWFGILAGVTTAILMAVNPDLPENLKWFMIVVPSVLALIAALQFSSALAVYWTTSNVFSALQTVAVHKLVAARIKSGALKV